MSIYDEKKMETVMERRLKNKQNKEILEKKTEAALNEVEDIATHMETAINKLSCDSIELKDLASKMASLKEELYKAKKEFNKVS